MSDQGPNPLGGILPEILGEMRRVLAWLVEGRLGPGDGPGCESCGHDRPYHRVRWAEQPDGTKTASWPCVWPVPDGPGVQLCKCPDWLPPPT